MGAGAHDVGGDFGEAGRGCRDGGIAAAEIKLAGKFRHGVGFDEHHFQAIGEACGRFARARRRAFRGSATELQRPQASRGPKFWKMRIGARKRQPSGSAFLRRAANHERAARRVQIFLRGGANLFERDGVESVQN